MLRHKNWLLFASSIIVLAGAGARCLAEDSEQFKKLQAQVEELRRRDTEREKRLEQIEKALDEAKSQAGVAKLNISASTALDLALSQTATEPRTSTVSAAPKSAAILRLIDVSFDVLWAGGGSTETDKSLQTLQGGGHDPRKRGFTFPNTELSLSGAVDEYFNAEAHLVQFLDPLTNDTQVELEEAFLTTTSMPYGLQVKAGQFFTEFGRLNAVHPHAWFWEDQPIINTRVLGPDGMRGTGFRVSWLTPAPWFSEVYATVQNAHGEQMSSFLANETFFADRPIGGRPFFQRDVKGLGELAYTVRSDNSVSICEDVNSKFGLSAAFGPNASGPAGRTEIYGADFFLKWVPHNNDRGRPFLRWENEFMFRNYHADSGTFDPNSRKPVALRSDSLHDWGFYSQALYGFRNRWDAGLRIDYATGSHPSVGAFPDRQADPFRDDRLRLSPLAIWNLSEFSRVRFQYNYDHAEHLTHKDAQSFWIGFEFLIGAHPAHKY